MRCFRGRSHENQTSRAAALNLVTAAIVLFNSRYLGRMREALRKQGRPFDEKMLSNCRHLTPIRLRHFNQTSFFISLHDI
ncbi:MULTISPECIES: Tn3 family transposase [Rhizobium]|uniref:Tn3 family transposase n=1 Tax=Rhizobium TaxID=379 RepID=UPI001616DF87|nr:Tn3 family transposase [Rhizobium paranaense]